MIFRLDVEPDFATDNPSEVFQAYYARICDGPRMLDSWQTPWRQEIVDAVKQAGPLSSLYEIGCGAGPNLKRLKAAYPDLTLGGCDFAQPLVELAAPYGEVTVQSAPCKVGREWDATLTCYALAYLDPHELADSLRAIESRYLILAEPMGTNACEFVVPLSGALPFWVHDYQWFLVRTGWKPLWSRDLPEPHDSMNRILIAERGD